LTLSNRSYVSYRDAEAKAKPENTEAEKPDDGDPNYLLPNWDYSVDKFDDMGLKEEVLRGIYGYGFNKPSAIQMKGILPVIQGNDTIA
jgi:translation initiation factor 4A